MFTHNDMVGLERTQRKVKNFSQIVSLLNTFVSIGLWLTFSFLITGNLNFGKMGNRRLGTILETIAVFSAILSVAVIMSVLHLQRSKEQFETKDDENSIKSEKVLARIKDEKQHPYKKYLRISPYYMDAAAITILATMQVSVSIALWTNLDNKVHKLFGFAFDTQTIVDTIGLSILFISLLIRSYNKITERYKNKSTHSDEQSKKDLNSKPTKENNVTFAFSLALPAVGFTLMFLGKIWLGIESTNTVKIPVGQGYFPLALLFRMVGGVISIASLIVFDLMSELNKTSIEEASLSSIAGAAAGAGF